MTSLIDDIRNSQATAREKRIKSYGLIIFKIIS
jgi:hypothetical protein